MGLSLYNNYSRLVGSLQSVKHVYYLPQTKGRIPSFFNIALDPSRHNHYLLNPTLTSLTTEVAKELERFSKIAPDMTHDEYLQYLSELSPTDATPWRKVPLHGTTAAINDKGFTDVYGPILAPSNSTEIHARFQQLYASIPKRTCKEFYRMYMTSVEMKLAELDQAADDDAKDTIGEELLRLYDRIARLGASQVHEHVRPFVAIPSNFPMATPHHPLAPHTQYWHVLSHPYSTSRESRYENLPRFAVEDMRKWFISRSKVHLDPNFNQDTCPYDPEDLLIYEETLAKIDQSGVFGITPCPFDIKEWPWNKK